MTEGRFEFHYNHVVNAIAGMRALLDAAWRRGGLRRCAFDSQLVVAPGLMASCGADFDRFAPLDVAAGASRSVLGGRSVMTAPAAFAVLSVLLALAASLAAATNDTPAFRAGWGPSLFVGPRGRPSRLNIARGRQDRRPPLFGVDVIPAGVMLGPT
jgi:hypothetical protein